MKNKCKCHEVTSYTDSTLKDTFFPYAKCDQCGKLLVGEIWKD